MLEPCPPPRKLNDLGRRRSTAPRAKSLRRTRFRGSEDGIRVVTRMSAGVFHEEDAMRLRIMLPMAGVVTMLSGAQAIAGPVVVACGPGQHAIPRAIKAIPATRATGNATPANSTPRSSCPTSDGAISSASPVAASLMAAVISACLMSDTWQRWTIATVSLLPSAPAQA